MSGKRRRRSTCKDLDPQSNPACPEGATVDTTSSPSEPGCISAADPQLTYPNLLELQAHLSSPPFAQFPEPFDGLPREQHSPPLNPDVPSSGLSNTSRSRSSMTTPTQAERKLTGFRFFIDLDTPWPTELASLVAELTQPRSPATITPNSKLVAGVNNATKYMLENEAKHVLLDRLVYPVKLNYQDPGDEGEAFVWRGIDHPWGDSVPKPQGGPAKEEKDLQDAMNIIGAPSKPKPDAEYGYPDRVMDMSQITLLKAWYPATLVYESAPWFPYLAVEWKGKDKTIQDARSQARRDCPTAIAALYNLFVAAGWNQPSVKSTCIFSLCVDSNIAEHRIHWRDVDAAGRVSYHAEKISIALLADESSVFRLRGTLLNALLWVRGARIEAIQEAMSAIQKPAPPPPPSKTLNENESTKDDPIERPPPTGSSQSSAG
ncbi:MAG: hypothetical protein LQ344_005136 [Seirophora lacunosa]|nr:MAG: hypothetical protein LQ344_005136 [Seirophora lacunosa]